MHSKKAKNTILNASPPAVLLNSQMAGYIYALWGLCQNTYASGSLLGALLYQLMQQSPSPPPSPPFDVVANGNATIALRCFMTLVGSDDFSAALEDEFSQESSLPAASQCQAFMIGTPASVAGPAVPGLYQLLKQAYSFVDYAPPSPAPSPPIAVPTTVLELCQKFVAAHGQQSMCSDGAAVNVYNRMIQSALLDPASSLAQIVLNIGQKTVKVLPYVGYPNETLVAYTRPQSLDQIGHNIITFRKNVGQLDPQTCLGSLSQIQSILNLSLPGNPPPNDPIYQLVIAILWDNNFNTTAGYPAALAQISSFTPAPPDPNGFVTLLQTNLGLITSSEAVPWNNNPLNWSVLITNLQAYVFNL